jgi:hypothetical protein
MSARVWRTDAGQWFASQAEAAAAAELTLTRRYGPVALPTELPALLAWLNAWPAPGHPVEPSANLAGVPPAERNARELVRRGWQHAIPGYAGAR